jgi:hypothetical protein
VLRVEALRAGGASVPPVPAPVLVALAVPLPLEVLLVSGAAGGVPAGALELAGGLGGGVADSGTGTGSAVGSDGDGVAGLGVAGWGPLVAEAGS